MMTANQYRPWLLISAYEISAWRNGQSGNLKIGSAASNESGG